MAATFSVFTKILGEDLASEVFRKVGSAAAAAHKPIDAFNKAVGEPKTTALGTLGAKVDGIAGKFRSGLSSISSWLPALGALGAIGTLGGLIGMARHAAEGFEGLTLASEKLGVSTKDLALWRYGAKLAGVESEAMEKGFVKLNKTMYDAATGKNKDVALLFQRMGIPLKDARGQIRNVGNSLDDIAESFKRTEDPATRDAMAIALFGRAGADLLPFLIKGRAGIAELREETARYSGLTAEHREGLEHLALSYKQLDKAGAGLSSRLGAVLAPHLAKTVDLTTGWIVANRELIAQSVERKIGAIGKVVSVVSGGVKALLALPLVAELTRGADASTAFDVALGLLGLTMAGPLLSGIQAITMAWYRMSAAIVTNPVGAALALLALQVWSVSKHWDENMTAIQAASERGFGAQALEIFKRFNGLTIIAQSVNDLVKSLTGLDLGALFLAPIKQLISDIEKLVPDFNKVWQPIRSAMDYVGGRATAGMAGLATDTAATGGGIGAGDFNPAAYGGVPAPPAPDSPAALAAGGGVPQKVEVEVVVKGEVKAPPGSSLTATAGGGAPAAIGRSMADHN